MSKRKILLSALLANSLALSGATYAIQVGPSCDAGAYSVFDIEQCQPPTPQKQQINTPVKEKQQPQKPVVKKQQPQKVTKKETKPVQVTPVRTIVEKKKRFFTDWGPYKQKSPQELLKIIRELLAQQAPVASYPQNAPVGCCSEKWSSPLPIRKSLSNM